MMEPMMTEKLQIRTKTETSGKKTDVFSVCMYLR